MGGKGVVLGGLAIGVGIALTAALAHPLGDDPPKAVPQPKRELKFHTISGYQGVVREIGPDWLEIGPG
jgi:hypothetical protein